MTLIGIDLGTTYSSVAYVDARGAVVTIPNAEGDLTTPSVVLYESNNEVVVGREAKLAAAAVPDKVAECVKRYMGEDRYPRQLGGRHRSPVEISAEILRKLKRDAEAKLKTITGCVITVPAYFDESRRHATTEAGRLAGLNVIDIINEPTAAALAYAYNHFVDREGQPRLLEDRDAIHSALTQARTVMVYDLGGGTFDVTLLQIQGRHFRVLATEGDVRLGGKDWDEAMAKVLAQQFMSQHPSDPLEDPRSQPMLLRTAEEVKRNLSARSQSHYVINHAGQTYAGSITREEFDRATNPLLYRTERRVTRVLRQAGLEWSQVDEVLTVGGSTRMPQVRTMLKAITGKEPNTSLSPDEAVSAGAAIQAVAQVALIEQKQQAKPSGKQPAPSSPAQAPAGSPGKPASKPTSKPAGRPAPQAPPQPPLDDDEVLDSDALEPLPDAPEPPDDALPGGAASIDVDAILGRIDPKRAELLRSIRITDVNSHSFGVIVTTADRLKAVSHLIPRNSPLPAQVTRVYGTVAHGQRSVSVRVVEGESPQPEDCLPIGLCRVDLPAGLPPRTPIEVRFALDAGGQLHVQARWKGRNQWSSVTIDRSKPPSA